MAKEKPTGKIASSVDPDVMRAELSALWQNADGGKAFVAALEECGYLEPGGEFGVRYNDHCVASSPEGSYEAFRLYKRKRRLYRIGLRPVGEHEHRSRWADTCY